MSAEPTLEELQLRVSALKAELRRLHAIEAAAQEALAFLAGRRPGFAATYARDVLHAALRPGAPRPGAGHAKHRPRRRKRGAA